jgi:hypothetical protein
MRPLLLHTSSSCVIATPRRVIHLEFAAEGVASRIRMARKSVVPEYWSRKAGANLGGTVDRLLVSRTRTVTTMCWRLLGRFDVRAGLLDAAFG